MTCNDSLNKFVTLKPVRIIFGIFVVIVAVLGCFMLLEDPNGINAKLVLIPETKDRLISFNGLTKDDFEKITFKIDEVYYSYQDKGLNVINCNDDHPPQGGQSCDVSWKEFGPCSIENYYSYHRSAPCVFLKIQKTRDWTPKYVNASDPPPNMPEHLKNYISNDQNRNKKAVWVSCEGEDLVDKENIGAVSYYPSFGFPFYYFPWSGQKGYLEPIIAVHFERPTRGVVTFIKCTMWTLDSQESVIFALYIL